MKKKLFMLLAAFLCLGAQAQAPVHVTVTNPSKEARKDVPVVIDIRQWGDVKKAVVTVDGKEVPSQLDDIDRDCVNDELCFLVDLDKKETKEVSVQLLQEGDQTAYPARTFAELVLPSRNKKLDLWTAPKDRYCAHRGRLSECRQRISFVESWTGA